MKYCKGCMHLTTRLTGGVFVWACSINSARIIKDIDKVNDCPDYSIPPEMDTV